MSLPTDTDCVTLATLQPADVTGGAAAGADEWMGGLRGLSRGVVGHRAIAWRPGDKGGAGETVQRGLQVRVRTGTCRKGGDGSHEVKQSSYSAVRK